MAFRLLEQRRIERLAKGPILSLGPAITLVTLPTIAALFFTLRESARGSAGVDIYRQLLLGESQVGEFWRSALFSLTVGLVSTLLAGALALGLVSWWHQQKVRQRSSSSLRRPLLRGFAGRSRGSVNSKASSLWLYSLVVSVPHLAWASALFLWLAQSGFLARLAFGIGLIEQPSDFPSLVADPTGFGLMVHYVTKETPFIVVAAIAALSVQQSDLNAVAAGLGAGPFQRARYVTWPAVRPAIAGAMLISFGFVLHSVEAPIVLGGSRPRMMSVVAAELFSEPTLERRSSAAAIGMLLTFFAMALGGLGALLLRKRTHGSAA